MALPTPAIAPLCLSTGESGKMKAETSLWPPPSNFVWRFHGGRSNGPACANAFKSRKTGMASGAPVLQDLPDLWPPLGYDDGDRDGESEHADRRGCRGCKKILSDEGRGFVKDSPLKSHKDEVALLEKGREAFRRRHLPPTITPPPPPHSVPAPPLDSTVCLSVCLSGLGFSSPQSSQSPMN